MCRAPVHSDSWSVYRAARDTESVWKKEGHNMKRCSNNMNEHVYNMEWRVYYSKWYVYSVEWFDKICIQNGNVHAIPLNKMLNDRKDFKVIVERNLQRESNMSTHFYGSCYTMVPCDLTQIHTISTAYYRKDLVVDGGQLVSLHLHPDPSASIWVKSDHQCVIGPVDADRKVAFISRISLQVSLIFALILILRAMNNIFHIISVVFSDRVINQYLLTMVHTESQPWHWRVFEGLFDTFSRVYSTYFRGFIGHIWRVRSDHLREHFGHILKLANIKLMCSFWHFKFHYFPWPKKLNSITFRAILGNTSEAKMEISENNIMQVLHLKL